MQRRLRSGQEVDRSETSKREDWQNSETLASRREGYGLHEVEQRTEEYCKRLKEQRHSRKEDRVNREEIQKLRDENYQLRDRCEKYQKLLETSGDPEVLRKFFELDSVNQA